VDRAVAAHRHDVAGAPADRLGREGLGVTRMLGPNDLHRPSLRPKRPGDHAFRAACRTATSRRIDDEVSLEHAASRYNSPAL
jgi:hypothetical protein